MSARARAGTGIGTLLLAAVVGLGAGYAVKEQCTRADWDGFQYRSSCYTDLIALYHARNWDREPVPYFRGDGEITAGEAGDLEYPVGTGYAVALAAVPASDATRFFQYTAILLAAAGLGIVLMLARVAADRRRVLLFALGPPVVLYAFHNWDLLAVLAMVGGLAAFARGRDLTAGVALGIGAATKVFPGLLVPVLVLARLHRGRSSGGPGRAGRLMLGAVGSFLAMNLPVLIANPAAWWVPWRYQSTRFPNYETSWYFLYRHFRGTERAPFWFDTYPSLTGVLSVLLFIAAFAILLFLEWRRPVFRPYATSLGTLVLFLLTAKVYSPQFALWVLPLLVLVRVRPSGTIWFYVTDAAVWFAVSAFLLAIQFEVGSPTARLNVLELMVLARYLALAWLLWLSWRAEDSVVLSGPGRLSA